MSQNPFGALASAPAGVAVQTLKQLGIQIHTAEQIKALGPQALSKYIQDLDAQRQQQDVAVQVARQNLERLQVAHNEAKQKAFEAFGVDTVEDLRQIQADLHQQLDQILSPTADQDQPAN